VSIAAAPGAVERTRCIQSFKAMGSEEIALGLDEIGGAALLAIAIEMGQRRGESGKRQALLCTTSDDMPEGGRCVLHHGDEIRSNQEMG